MEIWRVSRQALPTLCERDGTILALCAPTGECLRRDGNCVMVGNLPVALLHSPFSLGDGSMGDEQLQVEQTDDWHDPRKQGDALEAMTNEFRELKKLGAKCLRKLSEMGCEVTERPEGSEIGSLFLNFEDENGKSLVNLLKQDVPSFARAVRDASLLVKKGILLSLRNQLGEVVGWRLISGFPFWAKRWSGGRENTDEQIKEQPPKPQGEGEATEGS